MVCGVQSTSLPTYAGESYKTTHAACDLAAIGLVPLERRFQQLLCRLRDGVVIPKQSGSCCSAA